MVKYTEFFDGGLLDLIPIQRASKRPVGSWPEMKASRSLVSQWQGEGRNLGLRTSRFPAVDIDVLDKELAEGLTAIAVETLGAAPMRSGLPPKRTLLYQTERPFRKKWFAFSHGGREHRVEILAHGQYTVVAGVHPSGYSYDWPEVGAPSAAYLTWITEEQVVGFLDAAIEWLEERGVVVTHRVTNASDAASTDQDSLEAPDWASLEEAVQSIPNTSATFPTREAYLKFAIAVKAAWPEDEAAAYGLWAEWAGRWTQGTNDPLVMRRDWTSLRPPYRVGWPWLEDLLRSYGVSTAAEDFKDMPLEDPPADPDPSPPYSHAWLSNRFITEYGDRVRFCQPLGGWLRWDGSRFAPDEVNVVRNWAAKTCRAAAVDGTTFHGMTASDASKARRFAASVAAVDSTLSYSLFHPEVAAEVGAFDANEWLMNTPDGVYDLRTGVRMANDPKYMFTRMAAAAPRRVGTPKWDAFLSEATGGDPELVSYLQRLTGYSLTGSTREHAFVFFYGPGGNGKGVFLNTLVKALGTYAAVSAMDTFTATKNDRHPADLASLAGARMVTAQETQEGRSWDEARIKSITGGDPVSARFMRQDFFTFIPQFKLIISGNHKPRLHTVDKAMRRRLHLVPFTVQPRNVNQNLADELQEELPGIMQWALDGCIAWQKEGLNPPAAVLDATEAYFTEEDVIGRWLAERTDPTAEVTSNRDLYSDWSLWCVENGETPGTTRTLSQSLRQKGIGEGRTKEAKGFKLKLRERAIRTGRSELSEPVALDDLISNIGGRK